MRRKVFEIKDIENMSPVFKGKWGNKLAKLVMHIYAMNRVNRVYERSCDHTGADFSERLLNDLGVHYRIGNAERLLELPDGAFITISNHPYGGLDGIMLIDLMVRIRSDYKLMVNQILSTLIESMQENLISVQPRVGNKKADPTAGINGLRETLSRLREGHPVGFFPAGAVSMFSCKYFRVRDREWQESILKLAYLAKVPIVPIRFFNKNSVFFYFLGLINWRIRLVRMLYELFNKKGQRPRIGIGKIISVEEQAQFPDFRILGPFLRASVYDMPKPSFYTDKTDLKFQN